MIREGNVLSAIYPKKVFSVLLALVLIFLFCFDRPASAEKTTRVELMFKDHLTMGMIEQDVYIEKVPGSGKVYRVTPAEKDHYIDAPLYATAEMEHRDPMNFEAVGPYRKGRPLGLTLREWLAFKGNGKYVCNGGKGEVRVSFENLVPNTVYTLWYTFMPTPETEPFSTYDIPLGARDGSQSVFATDDKGRAKYEVSFEPCLQLGGVQLAAMVALAWHSDGIIYGSNPGEFGRSTHVQAFTLLPMGKYEKPAEKK